jgi:hypothetical protein
MIQGREDGIAAIVHNQASNTRPIDGGFLIAIEACADLLFHLPADHRVEVTGVLTLADRARRVCSSG